MTAWMALEPDSPRFEGCIQPPEIVKVRPVLSVSRKRNDGAPLCTVIPISSTAPVPVRDFHYLLPQDQMPHVFRDEYPENWVKADMIQTVAFSRLTLPWHGRDKQGRRVYQNAAIGVEHQIEIARRLRRQLYLDRRDLDE